MSIQKTELNRILEIIGKIAKISADGNYIYRGEPECYPKVSSNLYRELEKIRLLYSDAIMAGIEAAQKEELKNAKKYTKETGEFEILTEIQHFGGKTNLIDFTTDYRIALFFTCDRFPFEDGRIILQDKTGAIKDWIREPQNPDPESRVWIQQSIFIIPPEGFIEPDIEILIPQVIKQPLLRYLEKEFDISSEKIYPDLHGFVSNQDMRFSAYMDFFKGFAYLKGGIKTKNPEEGGKNFQKAVNHFTETIKLMPEFTDVYRVRGFAYFHEGEVEKAITDYNKAIELKPDDAQAYCNRGLVYFHEGEVEKAITDYDKVIELEPDDAQAYCNRGAVYFHKGEVGKAITDYDKVIELEPDDAQAYCNRGAVYFHKGEVGKAITDYDKAIGLKPNYATAYYNRSGTYMLKGEVDKAIEDCNKAIEFKPNYAEAYYNRGAAYYDIGKVEEAIKDYTTAIHLQPNYANAYCNRGAAYYDIGKVEEAIKDYDTVIGLEPQPAHIYYNRAEVLLHLREWEKAKADLTTAKCMRMDITTMFHNINRSVEDFEKKTGIQLPPDIAALLTPP